MLGEEAFHHLLALQEVDARRSRIRQKLRQLAKDPELATARQRVDRLGRQLEENESRQTQTEMQLRRTELEIDAVTAERAKIRQHMYSGEAGERQLKQLSGKERDLAARQDRYETRLLELLEAGESLEERAAALASALSQAEAALAERRQQVDAETGSLQEEVAVLERESQARREPVAQELLKEYDYRRQRSGDPVAVPLREPDGLCGGCGLPLPPAMAKRVRRADRVIPCESCGRILCPATGKDEA